MEALIIIVFVIGYIAIALEHPIKINKTASALLAGVICWTLFILSDPSTSVTESNSYTSFLEILKVELGEKFNALTSGELYREFVAFELSEHLSSIAQILFFLLGAMTIVELVDAHHGFKFITDRIKTKNPKVLLWIICWVTFFLSAVLDNLTTTIVMLSLVRKLIANKDMRLFFAGMIVIAANAGGAWTPIGDVTTTMLWIGGQVTTGNIMVTLFLPSVACMLVPLLYLNLTLKGTLGETNTHEGLVHDTTVRSGKLMLFLGVGALIFVPIFKTITHMPPYTGILLGLGVLWVVSELINPDLDEAVKKNYTVAGALTRIDVPSVLFFLGILLAVGALESMQVLHHLASWLDTSLGDQRIIVTLIGLLSAIVDNVPLVAASMGMYNMDVYYTDHMVWEYLAYCAGTGGSILIIGSAAGVAAMGIEKIDFIWYLKRISLLAMLGYFAGAIVYLIIQPYLAVHPPA
ncbi:MAG TPA: sodium:proton antiporter NhaD [Cyclobacteriaceae bacterium]|jgi:Na+/H+ antiporter NhaD/arsenite permease-like protein|nr:sodium:proton antiporter NhaD [Cytophagales bacterium]HRE67762.1 sodium:proton antiporter NhaD [Cyclobacteriaceae bacterium]HRF34544.1 sodium:proton antiporter NhaD [Cyclobacteriaceae bacterium]